MIDIHFLKAFSKMTSIQFINALVLVDFRTHLYQQSTKINSFFPFLFFYLYTKLNTLCISHFKKSPTN